MKMYINYPKNMEKLNEAVAMFRADMILKGVEDLDISNEAKRDIIISILEHEKMLKIEDI